MKNNKRIFLVILCSLFTLLTVFVLASCTKPPEIGNEYYIEFSYTDPITNESVDEGYLVNLGDVITLPEAPEIEGIYNFEWYCDMKDTTLMPGEEIVVTEDMFYSMGMGGFNDQRYYMWNGHFSGSYEFETYIVQVNSFGETFGEIQYDLNGFSRESIVSMAFITMCGQENISCYNPESFDNIYSRGYVFKDFYLDENFETPVLLDTSVFVGNITLYAKWDYVGIEYTRESWEDFYTLSKIDNSTDIELIEIPEVVNFLPVKEINSDILTGTGVVSKITLPSSIERIYDYTFTNPLILEVVVGDNTEIDQQAFDGVKITLSDTNTKYKIQNNVMFDLTNKTIHCVLGEISGDIVLPEGITDFGTVFAGSAITSIYIPSTVTAIADGAFLDCSQLKSVTIIDEGINHGVKTMGADAFKNCSSLKEIIIPSSLDSIGANAFYGCTVESVFYNDKAYAWKYIDKENALLTGTVYYYSNSEQTVEDYLYSPDEIKWHYVDGTPTPWIIFKNTLNEKTFTVTSATATISDYYWNALSAYKEQNMLDQVFEVGTDFYTATANATTKAELEAGFSAIYSQQYAMLVFENGKVTVSNDKFTGVVFDYEEINNRIIIKNVGTQYTVGELYVNADGRISEVVRGAKIVGNDTITTTYYYTEN